MLEFKGTKCKWKKNTETLAKGHRATKSIYITDEYGYTLCKMIDPDRECQEFNAQLISKAPELLEMLKEASSIIQRLKLSMLVHPDHEEGSEFDDMTSSAQDIEDEIEKLIKQATEI